MTPVPLESSTLAPPLSPEPHPAGEFGMRVWMLIVAACGIVSVWLGQVELGALVVLAGLFAVSQAADLDRRWERLHYMLSWVVPIGGAVSFFSLWMVFRDADLPAAWRIPAFGLALGGGLMCLVAGPRPFAAVLAELMFRVPRSSHTQRLAARIVLMGLLFSVPGWLAFQEAADTMISPENPMIGPGSLWGGLIGLTLLAFGGVGYLVCRDRRATLERLGLRALRAPDLLVVALGVLGLLVLNAGAEWIQRTWFPALYAQDQRVSQMLAGGLGRWETLLLGISAGVGEELSLRGALQPRLGLWMTSLLFAVLHVQYSWVGMAVILLLGLALGWIRIRAGTSAAVAVHALYDVLAALSIQQG